MTEKINAEYVAKNLPECTKFASLIRDQFGDDTKMIWAKENGHELGKQSSNGERVQRVSDIDLTPMRTAKELREDGRRGK
ncbi:hypothetical protein SAMN05216302_101452 [Nitrosomonas aestuarii]|uniref:Uncharacterized protein n=1 Tax=Nitrosomonas aestuarii TaxID=52441 RepID=A0A1I4C1W5_9PROT|nr:hypothetical protein [Nitrosomonas aestuarii]SFK74925.1 hypothetical protein SAMN05216302_101452 [Nitrosomonas aestuarii]